MEKSKFTIVGAGLVGSLMAIILAREGHQVEVYEKRPDMRIENIDGGRSINLALSHRGLKTLELVSLTDEIRDLLLPMRGRLIHDLEGNVKFQPYGKDDSEVINSISRVDLNRLLIDKADENDNVLLYFNHTCINYDNRSKELTLLDPQEKQIIIKPLRLIAADGANSAIRTSMLKMGRFNYSQEYMNYGYKELLIPKGKNDTFRIQNHGLHIWPRENFVMIALPNPDKTFTLTLFAPFTGKNSFEELKEEKKIRKFFETQFPDVVEHMPTLIEDMNNNPTGSLVTIRCDPWHKGNAVLIGDAAHAIIPFYGQGMNAGFEDVRILSDLITANEDWKKIIKQFSKLRKRNGDAIANLSYDNFIEMRDGVADEKYLKRKAIELKLYDKYDDIISKYAMVTFHPELEYYEAKRRGDIMEKVILDFQQEKGEITDQDLVEIKETLISKFQRE